MILKRAVVSGAVTRCEACLLCHPGLYLEIGCLCFNRPFNLTCNTTERPFTSTDYLLSAISLFLPQLLYNYSHYLRTIFRRVCEPVIATVAMMFVGHWQSVFGVGGGGRRGPATSRSVLGQIETPGNTGCRTWTVTIKEREAVTRWIFLCQHVRARV